MNEIIRTMTHIEWVIRKCDILTRSPVETLPDKRDRIATLFRLGELKAEAREMFQTLRDPKRVRKRAAAIRHRANGIFNQFHRCVCKRAADGFRVMWEARDNYRGFQQLRHTLGVYDYRLDPPGPVLFYPNSIIKIDLE